MSARRGQPGPSRSQVVPLVAPPHVFDLMLAELRRRRLAQAWLEMGAFVHACDCGQEHAPSCPAHVPRFELIIEGIL